MSLLRQRSRFVLLLLVSLLATESLSAHGQTGEGSQPLHVVITHTNVTDASGNLLVSGVECFVPVNNKGRQINATYSGGGISGSITTAQTCGQVLNGTLQAGFTLINSSYTNPQNLCYQLTLTDSITGQVIAGPASWSCLQPSTSPFEISAIGPGDTDALPLQSVSNAFVLSLAQVNALGTIANSTTGNAGTANRFASTPTNCGSEASSGNDAFGNPVACLPLGSGSSSVLGHQYRIAGFTGAGSGANTALGETNFSTDSTGSTLHIPGVFYSAGNSIGGVNCPQGYAGYNLYNCVYHSGLFDGSLGLTHSYVEQLEEHYLKNYGPGVDFGNYGLIGTSAPWRVAQVASFDIDCYARGICSSSGGIINKYAVGDANGHSWYLKCVGGLRAASDQGCTVMNLFGSELQYYYTGTVTATTGTGDTAPAISPSTNGFNNICDGCMMLDISDSTVSGNITGFGVDSVTGLPTVISSVAVPVSTAVGTVGSLGYAVNVTAYSIAGGVFTGTAVNQLQQGQQVSLYGFQGAYTYLNGAVLVVSSANGSTFTAPTVLAAGASNNTNGYANQIAVPGSPNTVNLTITLGPIGGVNRPFTTGLVSVVGSQFPEMAMLTAGAVSGNQQSISMVVRNPNAGPFIILQGGIAGNTFSLDAVLAINHQRPTYYAWGSLDGVSIMTGYFGSSSLNSPVNGTSEGQQTPVNPSAGTNNGFHLIPSAEVYQNTNAGLGFTLGPNNVAWHVGDVIENPHPPSFSMTGATIVALGDTPSTGNNPSAGINLECGSNYTATSAGMVTNGFACMSISNLNSPLNYTFNGGPVAGAAGLTIGGFWDEGIKIAGHNRAMLDFVPQISSGTQTVWDFDVSNYSAAFTYNYAPKAYAFTNSGLSIDYNLVVGANPTGSGLTGSLTLAQFAGSSGALLGLGTGGVVGVAPSSQIQTAIGSNVYDPSGAASAALATAEAYSSNASNLSSGTLPYAQLPSLAITYLPVFSTVQVNEYPYTAACNGSTDDSTTINAALASGATVVKLPPNGVTCAIAHQLVMPSNTKLDLNGATLVDTSSTGYMITNTNAIASAVQTQTNCAVTSGSATLTCTGGNMTALTLPASVIVTNGAYGCSSFNTGNGSCSASGAIPLVTWITAVSSSTVATMYQAANNTSSGTTAAFYNRDSGMEVAGGTLTRATGSSGTSNVFFQNADRISAHHLYFTGAAVGYNLFFANTTYIDAEHIKFNRTGSNSDGVHLDGPLLHGIVRDIGGATCDNMVAITGQDTYAGVVDDVLIDKVSGTSCNDGLVIAAGAAGALMNNITISNVQASDATAPPVLVRSFNSAFVRNVQTALSLSTDTVGMLLVQGANDANGTLVVENAKLNINNASGYSGATTYRAVTLQNTAIAPVGGSTHYLQGGGPGTTTINTFTANNLGCTSSSAGSCEFFTPPSNLSFGSFIGKGLALTSANTGQSDYFAQFAGTVIGNLNVQFTATGAGMTQLWQLNSGTNISSMTLDAGVLANATQITFGGGYNSTWVVGVNSGATVGTLGFTHADVRYMQGLFYLDAGSTAPSAVSISNAYLANDNRGLGEADKAVTINLNNVQNISGVNEALINCAANTITVLGVNYSASGNQASFTDCGSSTYRARINVSGGFPVNLGNSSVAASLAPSTGDVIYDTNSGVLKYWNSAAWVQLNAGIFQEVLTTPSSSSASCTAGQFGDDASYHYVCTAANTWKRVALTTF